ncbi:MAG: TonB family protein [Paracoccaceae bacterium]
MIRSSPRLLASLIAVSALAHGALAFAVFAPEAVEMDGGAAPTSAARLGTSFEDMAVGTLTPVPAATPTTQVATKPVEAPAVPPSSVERPKPLAAQTAPTTQAMPATVRQANSAIAPTPAPAAPPLLADASSAVTPLAPTPSAPPSTRTVLAALTPPEPGTLTALTDQAVETSPRPTKRPDRTTRSAAPQPQGNGARAQTAGSAQGTNARTEQRQAGASARSTASGNAAVANYPGLVMRAISRVRKPRVGARGSALVRFSVGANGGLASVSIARSSGSPRLDRAALQVIRTAAPFPKPPPGARRSFQIQITGRS